MAYNNNLATRIREYLEAHTILKLEEKKMFRGLTFMVNDKMCVNVSNDNMMCRFDPDLQEVVEKRTGFQSMVMGGKKLNGYCYVNKEGYTLNKDFEYWIQLCLVFNLKAKASKKKKK